MYNTSTVHLIGINKRLSVIHTYPSGLYDAKTMDGEEYALDVTHVQWTANIINIISTVTITIERILTPRPKII